jgi:hypothetical protein
MGVPTSLNELSAITPIPGFDPGIAAGIHVFSCLGAQDVDGRDKLGHDFGLRSLAIVEPWSP